jgi:hypothetical protein
MRKLIFSYCRVHLLFQKKKGNHAGKMKSTKPYSIIVILSTKDEKKPRRRLLRTGPGK